MKNNRYNVNASLIHEARMILTHVLRNKDTLSFFDQKIRGKSNDKQPKPAAVVVPSVKCCFCITLESVERSAITTIGGYSVCRDHAKYVRDEAFLKITTQIIHDKHGTK